MGRRAGLQRFLLAGRGGCYKALTKADMKLDVAADPLPMKRAVAFCKDIRSSKLIRDEFAAVVNEFLGTDDL
ncbi:hypothetical protein CNY89_22130, partial [Amaricoccus sp. HAR-UPW-R2A-40]